MANYLDLNGTTDVVNRIKAKINDKVSIDDMQMVVDELAFKANIEDTKYYTHNTNTIDGGYGIIVNPTEVQRTTKVVGGEKIKLLPNTKYYFDETYATTMYGKTYTISFYIEGGTGVALCKFELLSGGLFYLIDADKLFIKFYTTEFGGTTSDISIGQGGMKTKYVYFELTKSGAEDELIQSDTTLPTLYLKSTETLENGVYVDNNQNIAKIATTDDTYTKTEIDEKIGDINNALTTIIG